MQCIKHDMRFHNVVKVVQLSAWTVRLQIFGDVQGKYLAMRHLLKFGFEFSNHIRYDYQVFALSNPRFTRALEAQGEICAVKPRVNEEGR